MKIALTRKQADVLIDLLNYELAHIDAELEKFPKPELSRAEVKLLNQIKSKLENGS